MNDNDHITRGEARKLAYEILNHFICAPFLIMKPDDIDRMVDTIPAVPHEMSAREYLKAEARMCKHYGLPCAFDMSGLTVDEAIKMIEDFAREHPEEV